MYREGRLGNDAAKKLLPVTIRDERLVEAVKVVEAASPSRFFDENLTGTRKPRRYTGARGRSELWITALTLRTWTEN